jgi:hypothetical protein
LCLIAVPDEQGIRLQHIGIACELMSGIAKRGLKPGKFPVIFPVLSSPPGFAGPAGHESGSGEPSNGI